MVDSEHLTLVMLDLVAVVVDTLVAVKVAAMQVASVAAVDQDTLIHLL